MNRTIIILNFIISSSFTKPIDEFGKDDDINKMDTKTLSFFNDDDDISSFVNIDDLISNSEINKLYDSLRLHASRLKEPELDEAYEKKNVYVKSKTRQRKGNKDETDLHNRSVTKKEETKTSTEVENQQRRKSSSKDKSANDVESTTTNFNIEGRTGDYLDGPFEESSSVDSKDASEEEVEKMVFEIESPNDETNSEWDLLDDVISTRRMSNDKTVIVDETDKSSDEDTPISAKNKYEEKTIDSVENQNIEKDQISKGVKLDNLNANDASKTVENVSLDDNSSENMKTKDSQADEPVKSATKEKLENDETTKSVNKENRPYEETPKDSPSRKGDLIRQPPNFGNIGESLYVPRVHKTHSHPQFPLGSNSPPFQFRPVVPVNLDTRAKQGMDSRNMRLMPVGYPEQRRLENSREALESIESRNFDDFSYERNSNAYPYTPRNKNDYIFSKLIEASEKAQRPAVGLPLNKLPPKFGGISNLNTYSYPPLVRPFVA